MSESGGVGSVPPAELKNDGQDSTQGLTSNVGPSPNNEPAPSTHQAFTQRGWETITDTGPSQNQIDDRLNASQTPDTTDAISPIEDPRSGLITELSTDYPDLAGTELEKLPTSVLETLKKESLLQTIDNLNAETKQWLLTQDLETVRDMTTAAQALNVMSEVAAAADFTDQPDEVTEVLTQLAEEVGDTPQAAAEKSQSVKQRLIDLFERMSDASLAVLLQVINVSLAGNSFGDFLSNFLGRSVDSFGSSGDYPWGPESGDEDKISREEFIEQFKHPKDFAQKFKKAYEEEGGFKEWLYLDDSQKVLLEKATQEANPQAIKELLLILCEHLFNRDDAEEQNKAWNSTAHHLAEALFPDKKQALGGKVWVYLRDEWRKGKEISFNKDLGLTQDESGDKAGQTLAPASPTATPVASSEAVSSYQDAAA